MPSIIHCTNCGASLFKGEFTPTGAAPVWIFMTYSLKLFIFFIGAITIVENISYAKEPNSLKSNRVPSKANYTFSISRNECLNSRGKKGYNHGTWGECSDLTSTQLKTGRNQKRIQRLSRRLLGSTLEGTNLSRTVFRKADMRFVKFSDATLHNVIFLNTNLLGADFRGADLSGTQFQGYGEKQYRLAGALFDSKTILTTLLSSSNDDQDYISANHFAFSHDMIRLEDSSEEGIAGEIEGGFFSNLEWDETAARGRAVLNVFTREIQLRITHHKIFLQAIAFGKGVKVKVGVKEGSLIFVESLSGMPAESTAKRHLN